MKKMSENNQLNWQKDNFENIEEAWEDDFWDRKRLGVQLERYVDRLQCGAVLALDARWGEGKTWFVRHWAKHLTETEHNVIYLDAFANDYLDDPFLMIAAEISQAFRRVEGISDNDIKEFDSKTASLLISLMAVIPMIAAKAGMHWIGLGGAGDAVKEVYEQGKEVFDVASDEIASKVKEQIEKKIENHHIEKQTIQDFKEELAELAEKLEKPLVFIIDELDRCRPDFAIRLIERIKHFFDITKIVFVLVMDKTQFSKVICHNYGYDEKLGEEYLDKFVDFFVGLNFSEKYEESMPDIVRSKLKILGFDLNNVNLGGCVELLIYYSKKNRISKRSVSKILNQFSLLSLQTFDAFKNQLLMIFLINRNYLKVENTLKLYEILIFELDDFIEKNEIEFQEFSKIYEDSGLPLFRVKAMFFQEKNNINIFEELAILWFQYNNSNHPSDYSRLNTRKLRPNQIPELLKSWINYLDCGI